MRVDIDTCFMHALRAADAGMYSATDFPVDHRAMAVAETPDMAQVRAQIEALQRQYAAMRETEQKRLWKAFLYVVKHGQARKRPRLARGQ